MHEMSTELHKRHKCNRGSPGCARVVLYHSGSAVISVEIGTTLGLTKLLYESVGGDGKIIGLRQRRDTSVVDSFITQDQTILTDQEYDIILNAKSKSSICENRDVSAFRLLGPDLQLSPTYPTSKQITWEKDIRKIVNRLETTTRNGYTLANRRDDLGNEKESTEYDNAERKEKIATRCGYLTDRSKMTIHYKSKGRLEDSDAASPTNSPSRVGNVEDPDRSNQNSPSQIVQSRRWKRKWQCSYCKKLFACRSAYETHERTHTGEKPFRCHVCGRCFGNRGNLRQHLLIHRDVKPFICDLCGQGFTRSNRLKDHMRLHQNELNMQTKATAQQMVAAKGCVNFIRNGQSPPNDEIQETL